MAGDLRELRFQAQDVQDHNVGGDGGHTGGEDCAEFGACHFRQVRPDGKGGLDACEDVACGDEGLGAGDVHKLSEYPRKAFYYGLHYVEKIQDGDKSGEEDNRWEGLKGKDKAQRGFAPLW